MPQIETFLKKTDKNLFTSSIQVNKHGAFIKTATHWAIKQVSINFKAGCCPDQMHSLTTKQLFDTDSKNIMRKLCIFKNKDTSEYFMSQKVLEIIKD